MPTCGRTPSSSSAATTRPCRGRRYSPRRRSCSTGCCSSPSPRTATCFPPRASSGPTSIAIRTTRGLFGAINRGNAALAISAYNGGLFAEDPVLDSLAVSDDVCRYFKDLGDFDYRPAHEASGAATSGQLIDVDILG